MSKYLVTFREVRHYEMAVEAPTEELAIRWARTGPEFPVWTGVELDNYVATEIRRDAP